MLILAIDTALDACAAGVLDTESTTMLAQQSLPMKRGHAEALVPLIARVMAQAGVGYAALDRIAVTTGPGSFTGLRVGLSAARGIALGRRQAGGRPHHAHRLCRAAGQRERRRADHFRDRCAA